MQIRQYLNEPPEGMDIFLYPSNSLFVKIVYAYLFYTLVTGKTTFLT